MKNMNKCTYMITESLYCTPDTNTTCCKSTTLQFFTKSLEFQVKIVLDAKLQPPPKKYIKRYLIILTDKTVTNDT